MKSIKELAKKENKLWVQKNKILISGYYGFDNSGDDAILRL